MPSWSRRRLLAAIGAVGLAGGGWYLAERPHCRPRREPRWTYRGEHWGPVIPNQRTLLLPEGYGVTGGSQYRLAAVDRNTGQARWSVVAEGGGFGVPTRHDGTVYVGTGRDTIRAIDAETGARRWAYEAGGREEYGGGAWGAPLVAADRIYVGISHSMDPDADPTDGTAYTHRVVALDPGDGTELWATDVSRMVWAGPAWVDGTVVAASRGGTLYGFDPATGGVRFEFSLPGGVKAPLSTVGEEFVSLLTEDGTVGYVDVPDATLRRTQSLVRETTASEWRGDTLYVGGKDGLVVAVAADSDRVRWEYDLGTPVDGIAADPDVGVVAVDRTGRLHWFTEEGSRESQVRIVERPSGDRCGWPGDVRRVTDATLVRGGLYVAGRTWTRRFPVSGE
jgi:outer membrane protein assembly factor BamB